MPLTDPADLADLLAEVTSVATQRGIDPRSECLSTIAVTERFAGWGYRITRELYIGEIDCSTLVSQSLWVGAGVAAPFIAETQRKAYSALAVEGGRLPGDVLIRFPSLAESSDARHNHVSMYLGPDSAGTEWIAESRRPEGVRALPLYPEAALGGVRRFLPNPTRVFEDQEPVLRLAAATPKVARIGARLGLDAAHPHAHRGIDVYFERPVEVLAPFAGRASLQRDGSVVLTDGESVFIAAAVAVDAAVHDVAAGAVLGLCAGGDRPRCNAADGLTDAVGLHLEYWTSRATGYSEERSVTALAEAPGIGLRAYNPLYAIKLGLIGLPVTRADTARALTLPLPAPVTPAQ